MKEKIFFLSVLVFSTPVFADTPANVTTRFQELESRIIQLQNQLIEQDKKHEREIESLKKQVIEIKGPEEKSVYIPPTAQTGPKWLEGLEMNGDLRLRYEAFEQNEATRDRNRFRYRLRWGVQKKLTEDMDVGFRLVSGSNTDPTSTMQTFTGDFTYKNIFVDQAYVKYRPSFLKDHIPFLEKSEIGGGKVENPFRQASSGLVWDADVMPEGFYQSAEFKFFDGKLKPFVNLGQFILQENATLADAELYGFQTGIRWDVPGLEERGVKVTNAFAYYDFSDYARDSNFTVGGTSLARGNTAMGTLLNAGDFDVFQAYNEIEFKVSGLPVKLFGDFAANPSDRTEDPIGRNIGYEYGLRLGKAKKKGEWEAAYYYAYIEPNAVVGAFNESDFGVGNSNKRGSAVQLKYQLTDSLRLGFAAYFVNNVTGADDETRRFQTDLEWVF